MTAWDSVCYCTEDEISPSCMIVRHREDWWYKQVSALQEDARRYKLALERIAYPGGSYTYTRAALQDVARHALHPEAER